MYLTVSIRLAAATTVGGEAAVESGWAAGLSRFRGGGGLFCNCWTPRSTTCFFRTCGGNDSCGSFGGWIDRGEACDGEGDYDSGGLAFYNRGLGSGDGIFRLSGGSINLRLRRRRRNAWAL